MRTEGLTRCRVCSAMLDHETSEWHYEWHDITDALIAKALRLAQGALA